MNCSMANFRWLSTLTVAFATLSFITSEALAFTTSPPPPSPALFPLMDSTIYGEYVQVGIGYVVAVHLCSVPGTNKFMFMERPSGHHPDKSHNIIGYFDLTTNTFTNRDSVDSLFCAGHTIMNNGSILVVGGHTAVSNYVNGLKSIRIFNRETLTLTTFAQMKYGRWYPTATLLPDGKIVIMGGTQAPGSGTHNNPFYELWDPANPTETTALPLASYFVTGAKNIYYPHNYVLPSGDLWIWCNRVGGIIKPDTGATVVEIPTFNYSSKLMSEYPWTSAGLMLPLTPENNYTPEIMVFGGSYNYAWINSTASDKAFRIKVVYDQETGQYDFTGGWQQDSMPSPRVMPDVVLLPNGKVIGLNGAQKGIAGDNAPGGVTRCNRPNFWAFLYDPAAPIGSRFTKLARSPISRLYHSTAGLTQDGTIIVTGCDRCAKYWTSDPVSLSPTGEPEYRVEVFKPPFYFFDAYKPTIVTAPERITYNQQFGVTYSLASAEANVTSAVLVAPSCTTHSTNMHQRVVGLVIASKTSDVGSLGGTLMLQGPPTVNIAPPGMYMLFLVNGDYYGQAKWVLLAQ